MIDEFGGSIDKTIDQLDYLADLGINCIEVMPVSNIANTADRGFLPIGYFGVDERFGKRRDLQRLIDAAHQRGIAVILDVVCGRTSDSFAYFCVYQKLGYQENPFMGPSDYSGASPDFRCQFTRDFFLTVNHHWLDCYHVDGFRYDCALSYWDSPMGQGYADLTYQTYQMVKARWGSAGHWQRFFRKGNINLVQCADRSERPREVLEKTYSNCTCQDETFGAAREVARGNQNALTDLGLRLGLCAYPEEVSANDDTIQKTALQYIENHDHSRFICNFHTTSHSNELLPEGDRRLWYKLQPYLIGLFTAKGIPMLWQGQEFGENYSIPEQGIGRVLMFRPVRWDYFYDPLGKNVIRLVRKLIRLRRQYAQFRHGKHYFYNDHDRYQSRNVILLSREYGKHFSLIALNFGDHEQRVPFNFPYSGNYWEELHGTENLANILAGEESWLTVPSNYGCIWTMELDTENVNFHTF
jgi:1,4-alpha-glucan branching enzyme